ncbi:MAG: GTP-binding protein TypA [Spirochaetes bacterium GWB1_36_13]|nr:MAG: GTP-binding protein TypA [Spirochaetes bacterium GWB1_36_13]
MDKSTIRNIAIIAHVDHGKTTLVDQLFKQSGMFRDNQVVQERMMDSMDLERERGITITSKNGSFRYKDFFVNIIDTPGHADFGGQVERVLRMADGALLLVDAAEGPMPQTYFVLKKALALNLPILVVINKIDKPNARCEWVVNEVFDLFVRLNAPDHILDFPVVYASARSGVATLDYHHPVNNMVALFDKIVSFIPEPAGDPNAVLQLLISSINYSSYLGRLGIGKITNGTLKVNQEILLADAKGDSMISRVSKLYHFQGNDRVEVPEASAGEIVAVAGMEYITVGDTITDKDNPMPLPGIKVDPPTISVNFIPNDSPFAGREGKFVTSRHIRERLYRETLSDTALVIEELQDGVGYKVSGRGELHISILIEKMRREDYEFQVTRPQVIFKTENGKKFEPYEELLIDVEETYSGKVIENLGKRKGILQEMSLENGMNRLKYKIPTRGLLGFRNEFMTATKGMGTMNYIFSGFEEFVGDIKNRKNGVLLVKDECETIAYALFNLQERGELFMGPGEKVYGGQIIGECSRDNDMVVNPGKGKQLTNIRAAGCDENVILTPPRRMSLEVALSYINDDELIEITPKSIRLRKKYLSEVDRKRARYEGN